ncbi:MAG: SDR family oxidoreductase [Phycisphaerales bacterium]
MFGGAVPAGGGGRPRTLATLHTDLFHLLLQDAAPPASRLSAEAKSAVQEWAKLSVALLVIVVGLFTAWWAWWRWHKTRRHALEDPHTPTTVHRSAWEEAGKRIEVPGAGGAGEVAGSGAPRPTPRERLAPLSGQDHPPVALITGGARRVGREVALELARAGCDIILTYLKSYDEATLLAREISSMGRTVWLKELDLGQPAVVETLADELSRTLPRLDIVVHNASLYGPTPLEDLDAQDVTAMFHVNALGPLLLTTRLRNILSESPLKGGGCVIALSDIHAQGRPRRNFSAYLMSKAALDEMVDCLARDLAPSVRVNGVALGVVAWPEADPEMTAEEQKRYIRRIPLGRAGEPSDAASAVRWLALGAPYVTGAVIRVDGGRWLG